MAANRHQSLEDALVSYDRDQDREHLEAAEEERQEMLRRFPLENWPQMPLEKYALGQSDSSDTYCYWLEFGASHLGSMRGGSSTKHLIYKHKNKPGWYHGLEYATVEEAWATVRSAFVEMFGLAQAGAWEKIEEIEPLSGGRALRIKSLHVYFPSEILPITSIDHIRQFLQRLDAYDEGEMRQWDVRLNRALLHRLHSGGSAHSLPSPDFPPYGASAYSPFVHFVRGCLLQRSTRPNPGFFCINL